MRISQSAATAVLTAAQGPNPNGEGELTTIELLLVLLEDKGHAQIGGGEFKEGLRWKVPGGRVEGEETPAQAARRELLEEAGLELPADLFTEDRAFVQQQESKRQDSDFHRDHYFLVVLNERPALIAPNDPEKVIRLAQWFPLEALPSAAAPAEHAFVSPGNRRKLASLFIKTDWYLKKLGLSGYNLANAVMGALS